MNSALHRIPNQSTSKQDVPFHATPACMMGIFAALLLIYLTLMIRFGVYPGLVEVSVGAAFGTLSGLLTAWGWRGRIDRATNRRRIGRTGPLPLDEYEPGPDILLWVAGLPIAIGAAAARYGIWRAMPSLSMPWARFSELLCFNPTDAGGFAFPLKSAAAMIVAFGLVTYMVIMVSMRLWYRSLPDSSVSRDL